MPPSTSKAFEAYQTAERLFTLAADGSPEAFEESLGSLKNTDLTEVRDSRRRSLLHVAAATGNEAMVRLLVDKHNFPADLEDGEGETPLGVAAARGHASVVDLLLDNGARPDPSRPLTAGPLHRAAGNGQTGIVKRLLAAGANPSLDSGTGSALLWAAGAGHAGPVEALLAAGADPNEGSKSGMTPLFMAAAAAHAATMKKSSSGESNALKCVRLLLKAGADVNTSSNGFTALHVAAESGNTEMIQLLVGAGASFTDRDAVGNTPAELAASWHRDGALDLLLRLERPEESEAQRADRAAKITAEVESRDRARVAASGESPSAAAVEPPAGIIIPEPEEPSTELASSFKAKGTDAFGEGDFQAAVELWSFALRHETHDPTVWANRAAAFLKLKDYDSALIDARAARSINPSYVKAWYREGLAAEGLERWEDAALAYFEAYNLEPSRTAFVDKFQQAIEAGKREHRQRESQAAGVPRPSSADSSSD